MASGQSGLYLRSSGPAASPSLSSSTSVYLAASSAAQSAVDAQAWVWTPSATIGVAVPVGLAVLSTLVVLCIQIYKCLRRNRARTVQTKHISLIDLSYHLGTRSHIGCVLDLSPRLPTDIPAPSLRADFAEHPDYASFHPYSSSRRAGSSTSSFSAGQHSGTSTSPYSGPLSSTTSLVSGRLSGSFRSLDPFARPPPPPPTPSSFFAGQDSGLSHPPRSRTNPSMMTPLDFRSRADSYATATSEMDNDNISISRPSMPLPLPALPTADSEFIVPEGPLIFPVFADGTEGDLYDSDRNRRTVYRTIGYVTDVSLFSATDS